MTENLHGYTVYMCVSLGWSGIDGRLFFPTFVNSALVNTYILSQRFLYLTFWCHTCLVALNLIFIIIQIQHGRTIITWSDIVWADLHFLILSFILKVPFKVLNEQTETEKHGLSLWLYRFFLSFKGTFVPHHTATQRDIQSEQVLHTQCLLSSFSLTVLIIKAVEI